MRPSEGRVMDDGLIRRGSRCLSCVDVLCFWEGSDGESRRAVGGLFWIFHLRWIHPEKGSPKEVTRLLPTTLLYLLLKRELIVWTPPSPHKAQCAFLEDRLTPIILYWFLSNIFSKKIHNYSVEWLERPKVRHKRYWNIYFVVFCTIYCCLSLWSQGSSQLRHL
jgi:hypothetical protein